MCIDNVIFRWRALEKKCWVVNIDGSLWNIIIDKIGTLRTKSLYSIYGREG